jgi:GTP1/Obg family GTP-binding protein
LSTANNIDQKHSLDVQDTAPKKPFVIVVSGAPNVGKSALIKLAHHKLRIAETATSSNTTFHATIANVRNFG